MARVANVITLHGVAGLSVIQRVSMKQRQSFDLGLRLLHWNQAALKRPILNLVQLTNWQNAQKDANQQKLMDFLFIKMSVTNVSVMV